MLKKLIASLLLALFALSLFSCGDEEAPREEEPEYYSATFFAMDTEVTIRLARDTGNKDENGDPVYFEDQKLSEIIKDCADIAEEKEAILSRTDENSPLYELNAEADCFLSVNEELISVIKYSKEVSDKTSGAFDITIGTVTELWNVTGESPTVPADDAVAEALSHVGNEKIAVNENNLTKNDRKTKLDLGAIGKGYTLGKIIEHLQTTDVKYGVVSFGGNVGVFGSKDTWYKVGITDALDKDKVCGYVYISTGYVSVSGDYERFFTSDGKKYSHIFDPATGKPAESDITGIAVLCSDPSLADALSTALYVKGSEATLEFYKSRVYSFEAVIQKKDGEIVLTDGLKNGKFEKYVEPVVTTGE